MFESLEIFGIVLIIIGQIYIAYITFNKIREFKNVLLFSEHFNIVSVFIKPEDINTIHPKTILYNKSNYLVNTDKNSINNNIDDTFVQVNLITTSVPGSFAQDNILEAINTYLIRNRSAVADFNLIKDIVERTGSTIEEEVNNTISVPLYMGLLGTMLGIIWGLYHMPHLASMSENENILNKSIDVLLYGVKTAMIASFAGLLLTIVNSGIFFRKAKTIVEQKKNDFYSFIQIELLPVLNQSINSSLASLQMNLHKFNENFSGNINLLGDLMFKNHDAILAQEKVLTTLENIDINAFAQGNVKVLKELQKSTESFHSFNLYMGGVNDALNSTKMVVFRISQLIERTEHMNSLAENINKSFSENNRLITFFNDHRTGLDESKALLQESVGSVSKSLKDAIAELNDTTKNSINELRNMVTKEIKLMNDEYPQKWNKLDNLEEINKSINKLTESNSSLFKGLMTVTQKNNTSLKEINEQLVVLNNKKNVGFFESVRELFQRIFHKKNDE